MGSQFNMRALHLLAFAALVLACQAKRGGKFGGKELKPLHRVCRLNEFCDAGQFGPWIFEKGDTDCADFEGKSKKDDILEDVFDGREDEDKNCTAGTMNICALCFDSSFEVAKAGEYQAVVGCEADWRPRKPCEEDEDDEEDDEDTTRIGTSPKRLSPRFNKRRGPGSGNKGRKNLEEKCADVWDELFGDDDEEEEEEVEDEDEDEDTEVGQRPERISTRFNRRRGGNRDNSTRDGNRRGNKGRGRGRGGRRGRKCHPPMEVINICESSCRAQK